VAQSRAALGGHGDARRTLVTFKVTSKGKRFAAERLSTVRPVDHSRLQHLRVSSGKESGPTLHRITLGNHAAARIGS